MLLRQKERAKRREGHVFFVGERICFFLPDKKPFVFTWHMGDILTIPAKTQDGKLTAKVKILLLEDKTLPEKKAEDWETDAAPYFQMPAEVLILSRLLSREKWPDLNSAGMAEVDLRNACPARHTAFLDLLSPKRSWWDTGRPHW